VIKAFQLSCATLLFGQVSPLRKLGEELENFLENDCMDCLDEGVPKANFNFVKLPPL
tara:strand:+ start:189 stop:359 length:171 start_codon:yes stop_codon:yes gene_type:complete